MRGKVLSVGVGMLCLAGTVVSLAATASATQDLAEIETSMFDFREDVSEGVLSAPTPLHPELDIVEAASHVSGSDVEFKLRVRGTLDAHNSSVTYKWYVYYDAPWTPHTSPLVAFNIEIDYSNGSAKLVDYGTGNYSAPKYNITVVEAAGSTLRVSAPLSRFWNFTNVWLLEGWAEIWDFTGGSFSHWVDEVTWDISGKEDRSADPTAFASPTVNITSWAIEGHFPVFNLTVRGRTAGATADLLVAFGGAHNSTNQGQLWDWFGWWREENWSHRDPKASLEKLNGSWAEWKFVLNYDLGGYGYVSDGFSKVEVRATAPGILVTQ